jgi:sulfatase modifying factor 1
MREPGAAEGLPVAVVMAFALIGGVACRADAVVGIDATAPGRAHAHPGVDATVSESDSTKASDASVESNNDDDAVAEEPAPDDGLGAADATVADGSEAAADALGAVDDAAGDATPDGPDTDTASDASPDTDAAPDAPAVVVQPGCAPGGPGLSDCGPNGDEDCCASPLVPGGTFDRHYDDYLIPPATSYLATVSDFRLDRFEVTVGRFRRFLAAVAAGWKPAPGSGKHAHLSGSAGLAVSPVGDASPPFELGWDPAWSTEVVPFLVPVYDGAPMNTFTWTDTPGANDSLPVNEVRWMEGYAFCIWDGGFLPSEAEWDYAAAGGAEQRRYPWGDTPSGDGAAAPNFCPYVNFWPTPSVSCVGAPNRVGSESPLGDGKWGQADLSGNVTEWVLDSYMGLSVPPGGAHSYAAFIDDGCHDCVNGGTREGNVFRGGAFWGPKAAGTVIVTNGDQIGRAHNYECCASPDTPFGVRCARSP